MIEIKTGPTSAKGVSVNPSATPTQSTPSQEPDPHVDLGHLKVSSPLGVSDETLDAIIGANPRPDGLTAQGLQMTLPSDGKYTIGQTTIQVELVTVP